jgi:thioredoxin 1
MLDLSTSDFDGTTLLDSRNILALFYATWCPFCRTFVLTFEESMQGRGNPLGALVDISDMNSPLWERFNVEIVPTLIGFKDGRILMRKDGVAGVGLSARELDDAIREMR